MTRSLLVVVSNIQHTNIQHSSNHSAYQTPRAGCAKKKSDSAAAPGPQEYADHPDLDPTGPQEYADHPDPKP